MKRLLFLCFLSLSLTACGDDAPAAGGSGGTAGAGGSGGSGGAAGTGGTMITDCADAGTCAESPVLEIGGERPAAVEIPSDYTTATRYPLLVVLHGAGAGGVLQAGYFRLFEQVDAKQFVMVTPDGTEREGGAGRIWNATPACCAFTDELRMVDDVSYIRGLIEEARATYSIDPDRVYLFGHSNGGFMSFRMACEASELITAIASLAGSTFNTPEECSPAANPVSVLAIHGTADATILYDGASGAYPGAVETAMRFAGRAGCDEDGMVDTPANIDIDGSIDGAETAIMNFRDCDPGLAVSLWTIEGGAHIPIPWTDSFSELTTDWLLAQTR